MEIGIRGETGPVGIIGETGPVGTVDLIDNSQIFNETLVWSDFEKYISNYLQNKFGYNVCSISKTGPFSSNTTIASSINVDHNGENIAVVIVIITHAFSENLMNCITKIQLHGKHIYSDSLELNLGSRPKLKFENPNAQIINNSDTNEKITMNDIISNYKLSILDELLEPFEKYLYSNNPILK